MTPKAPAPTEHQEQAALFDWAELEERRYPELQLLYAVPNAGKRTPRQGRWMKDEGLRPGFPDVGLPVARGGFYGLFVELKRIRGGVLSDEQCWWIDALQHEGYKAIVCKGWKVASEAIEAYLSLPAVGTFTGLPAKAPAPRNAQE